MPNQLDEILHVACKAGKIMLESGGEIYRVEQTVTYLCQSLGATEIECFATPNTIIISIKDEAGHVHTHMRRITARSVNLHKIQAINDLSRLLQARQSTPSEALSLLGEIENTKSYPYLWNLAAAAFGTAGFSVLFGGTLRDFCCSFVLGVFLKMVVTFLSARKLNEFVINLAGGAIAAFFGWLSQYSGLGSNWWVITLSELMLMVPGLLITNALRDVAAGDMFSGLSRGTEAFSIAIALATGAAVTFTLLKQMGVFML